MLVGAGQRAELGLGVLVVVEGRLAGGGDGVNADVFFAVLVAAVADDQRVLVEERQAQRADVVHRPLAIDVLRKAGDHVFGLAIDDADHRPAALSETNTCPVSG